MAALLQDGIHPDPAAMSDRLLVLMQAATGTPLDRLNLNAVTPVVAPAAEDEGVVEGTIVDADDDAEATDDD